MAAVDLEVVFRSQWPRILATLVRFTGSLELAEDAIQQAFERAAASPDRALLLNPSAWITTVAKRIAIDSIRRDATLRAKLPLLIDDVEASLDGTAEPGDDDRLALLFVACSPDLPPASRLALALRFVGGLPTRAVAAVLLVDHATMSARLTRAKRAIEAEGIRFDSPDTLDLDARIPDVLAVIHSMYTAGHTAIDGDELGSRLLRSTSIEVARALRRAAPSDAEAAGLLALLLLTHARDAGRLGVDGRVVTLEDADRHLWDDALIHEGLDLASVALPGGGRFALEAGISGLHCQAPDWASTDWASIGLLYDRLVERWPSPAAQIARIVARSFGAPGPQEALSELDGLTVSRALDQQRLTARADILRRMGRAHEARAAYALARAGEQNSLISEFYGRRMTELDA